MTSEQWIYTMNLNRLRRKIRWVYGSMNLFQLSKDARISYDLVNRVVNGHMMSQKTLKRIWNYINP